MNDKSFRASVQALVYLSQNPSSAVSSTELASHLYIEATMLRRMLAKLVRARYVL